MVLLNVFCLTGWHIFICSDGWKPHSSAGLKDKKENIFTDLGRPE